MASGRPWPSQTACSLEFGRLRCARYVGERSLLEQAGGGPVRLKMGSIDHQLIRLSALRRERRKDAVEQAEPARADEAVSDRLVWTLGRRHIPPAQPVPGHENDAADDT